jgi:hypothetical protein
MRTPRFEAVVKPAHPGWFRVVVYREVRPGVLSYFESACYVRSPGEAEQKLLESAFYRRHGITVRGEGREA